MNYDLVVVGGSLAGTAAVINALEKGATVALIERNPNPFDPPHCGEGIDVITASFIDLKKIDCHMNPITKIIINLTEKYEYSLDVGDQVLTIFDRNRLENELITKTRKEGADVILGSTVIDFDEKTNVIKTDNDENISGKIIIDASGIQCVIGKEVGLKTKIKGKDIGVCIQSRVRGSFDPKLVKIWFDEPFAPLGYAWLFPISKNQANIGLGIPGGMHRSLQPLLDAYIDREMGDDAQIESTFRSCVPLATPLQRVIKNKVMITGDAARVVNPFLGSGIANAIFSGCFAGIVAGDYVNGNIKSIDLYQQLMSEIITRLTKTYRRREKIFEKDRYVPAYHKALIAFSIANKINPNYFNRAVRKTIEKNISLIQSYKKTQKLF